MEYSPLVMQHFYHPYQAGAFPEEQRGVLTGRAGDAARGDVVQIQVICADDRVVAAKFKAQGSIVTIAAASFLMQLLPGLSVARAHALTETDLIQPLAIPPLRRHCATIVLAALQQALAA